MNRFYHRREWLEYRADIIELDGNQCRTCQKSSDNGTVLQVHHTTYLKGRMPWEYPYGLCRTLCKGCHAAEHGLIKPRFGWTFLSQDDLGALCGCCEYCSTEIRHVFFIGHPAWGVLAVGTDCCDRMTGTPEASNIVKRANRIDRFVNSIRWKRDNGKLSIRQKRMDFSVETSQRGFLIEFYGYRGKERFSSEMAAKEALFVALESGKCEDFLAKKGNPHLAKDNERPRRRRTKFEHARRFTASR